MFAIKHYLKIRVAKYFPSLGKESLFSNCQLPGMRSFPQSSIQTSNIVRFRLMSTKVLLARPSLHTFQIISGSSEVML